MPTFRDGFWQLNQDDITRLKQQIAQRLETAEWNDTARGVGWYLNQQRDLSRLLRETWNNNANAFREGAVERWNFVLEDRFDPEVGQGRNEDWPEQADVRPLVPRRGGPRLGVEFFREWEGEEEQKVKPDATVNQIWRMYPAKGTPIYQRPRLGLTLKPAPFPYEHCVGVEIEVERHRWAESQARERQLIINEGFTTHADGSLRNNGIEFVTKVGLTAADAIEYIKVLDTEFAEARKERRDANSFTFRCGLHVHVDVTDHTLEDIYKAVLLYTVQEPLLFEVSGGRVDNKFCMEVHECESAHEKVLYYGHAKDWTNMRSQFRFATKYTSMNIAPVSSLGTIEFRQHVGTSNPDAIRNWLLILTDIVVGAKKIDTSVLETAVKELNSVSSYDKFLRTFMPNSYHLLFNVRDYAKKMYGGVAFSKQCFITNPADQEVRAFDGEFR